MQSSIKKLMIFYLIGFGDKTDVKLTLLPKSGRGLTGSEVHKAPDKFFFAMLQILHKKSRINVGSNRKDFRYNTFKR